MKRENAGIVTFRVLLILPIVFIGFVYTPILYVFGVHSPFMKFVDLFESLTFKNEEE